MIKNIILDIGGVTFDDSKDNIRKLLNVDNDVIYKKAYGNLFNKCLLGECCMIDHLNSLKDDEDYEKIEYILNNLNVSYPIIKDNFEYIKTLKDKGYKLYILSNITEDSYNYINNLIGFDNYFEGGIYSYQEHLVKPNKEIYELIINRYNLNKDETIFFDDKEKNVLACRDIGVKAFVFNGIDDIKNNLN